MSTKLAVLRYHPEDRDPVQGFNPPAVMDHSGSVIVQKLVRGVIELNPAVMNAQADWLLICLAGQRVEADLVAQCEELKACNPGTRFFVRQFSSPIAGCTANYSDFISQLCSITPTCILIEKSYLIEVGGFNETLSHAFDLELYLRVLLKPNPHVAVCSEASLPAVSLANPSLVMGARRVLQATQMAERYSDRAPAFWYLNYEFALKKIQSDPRAADLMNPSKVSDHLKYLVSQIAYRVKFSDQSAMSQHLERSVFDTGVIKENFDLLDSTLCKFFNLEPQKLHIPDHLRTYSLGLFCHAAKTLKRLALRQDAGPFDWIFTNKAAVQHMLEDRFVRLLDRSACVLTPEEDKFDPNSNKADHTFYREKFGVRFLFNHHDINQPRDYAYFRRAVELFLTDLTSPNPCMLVMFTPQARDLNDLSGILKALRALGPNNFLLVIYLKQNMGEEALSIAPTLATNDENDLITVEMPICSQSNGIDFGEPLDETRLQRLVHGTLMGWLGAPLHAEATAA